MLSSEPDDALWRPHPLAGPRRAGNSYRLAILSLDDISRVDARKPSIANS